MDDEIDIYGDLDHLDDEKIAISSEGAKELQESNAKLQGRIEELSDELKTLRKHSKFLETNISSLLKTSRVEIARKDRMIADLRKEIDDAAFRRNSSFRIPKKPPRPSVISLPPKDDSTCTEIQKEPVNDTIKKQDVDYQSPLVEDSDSDEGLPQHPDKVPVTVFGVRLKKRLEQETQLEIEPQKPPNPPAPAPADIKSGEDHEYRLIPLTLQKQSENSRKRTSENSEDPEKSQTSDLKRRKTDPENREKSPDSHKPSIRHSDRRTSRERSSENPRYHPRTEDRRRGDRDETRRDRFYEKYAGFPRNEDRRRGDQGETKREHRRSPERYRPKKSEDRRRMDQGDFKRGKSPDRSSMKSEDRRQMDHGEIKRGRSEDRRVDPACRQDQSAEISEDRRKTRQEESKREKSADKISTKLNRIEESMEQEGNRRDKYFDTKISSNLDDRMHQETDKKESQNERHKNSGKSEDRKIEIDRSTDRRPEVDRSNDRRPEVDRSNDRSKDLRLQLERSKARGVEINRSNDRRLEIDKSRDRKVKIDRSNDPRVEIDKSRDGKVEIDRSKDRRVEIDRSRDRRLENDRPKDLRLPIDRSNDPRVEIDRSKDRELEIAAEYTCPSKTNRESPSIRKIEDNPRSRKDTTNRSRSRSRSRDPRSRIGGRRNRLLDRRKMQHETERRKINSRRPEESIKDREIDDKISLKSRKIDCRTSSNSNTIDNRVLSNESSPTKGNRDRDLQSIDIDQNRKSIDKIVDSREETLDNAQKICENMQSDSDIEEGEIPDSPVFSDDSEPLVSYETASLEPIPQVEQEIRLQPQNLDDSGREEKIENIEMFIEKMQEEDGELDQVEENSKRSSAGIGNGIGDCNGRNTSDESVHLTNILGDSSDEEVVPPKKCGSTQVREEPEKSATPEIVCADPLTEKMPEKLREYLTNCQVNSKSIVGIDKDRNEEARSCSKARPILQEIGASTAVKFSEIQPQKSVTKEKENGGKGQFNGKIVVARRRKVRLTDASTSMTIVKSEESGQH